MLKSQFYDNKLVKLLFLLSDMLFLGVLFFVLCLPIITIGASAAALYHTAKKVFWQQEGALVREFLRCFWRELPKTTILALLIALIYGFFTYDMIAVFQLAYTIGGAYTVLAVLLVIAGVLITMWVQYWIPGLIRYDNSVKMVLINCFWISIENLGLSILLLLLQVLAIWLGDFLFNLIWPACLLLPSVYVLIANPIYDKVFQRYAGK